MMVMANPRMGDEINFSLECIKKFFILAVDWDELSVADNLDVAVPIELL